MEKFGKFTSNTSVWDELTSEQKKQRQVEWNHIKKNLKIMSPLMRFESGYLTAHKNLFFHGELSEKIAYPWAFFYLWFYPVWDAETCRNLMEEIAQTTRTADGRVGALATIRWNILLRQKFMQFHYESDYGLLGGREEVLIGQLMGEPGKGAFFDVPGFDEDSSGFSVVHMLRSICATNAVLRGVKGRHNVFGQYIWPHAAYYVKERISRANCDLNNEMFMSTIMNIISMLLFSDEHPDFDSNNIYAISARDRILAEYKDGKLDGPIQDWFEDVRSEGWVSHRDKFEKSVG